MKVLSDLLSRYSNIKAPDVTLKKAFIKAVENCIEITLDIKDIKISKKIIKINAPSVIKNEIRFNQQNILKNVSDELGDKKAIIAIF